MNKLLVRMVSAIFLGALFGSLVAVTWMEKSVLSLGLGIIVGGVIGAIALDPQKFVRGIVLTMKEVFWEPFVWCGKHRLNLALGIRYSAKTCMNMFSVSVICFWPCVLLGYGCFPIMIFMASTLLFGLPLSMGLLTLTEIFGGRKGLIKMRRISLNCKIVSFKYTNPISIIFVTIYFVAIGIGKAAKVMFALLRYLCERGPRFIVGVIKYIHSEELVQVLAYTVIGVMMSWSFNQGPLIGALVGAALGGIGFKLVSVRFLKLAQE